MKENARTNTGVGQIDLELLAEEYDVPIEMVQDMAALLSQNTTFIRTSRRRHGDLIAKRLIGSVLAAFGLLTAAHAHNFIGYIGAVLFMFFAIWVASA